jgi:hypothetical protein
MYRINMIAVACVSIAACATRSAETEQADAHVSDCLARETVAVAALPLDLETATTAVLARCDYPGVIERRLAAQLPGYREEARRGLQKVDMAGSIRRQIALIRAQRAQDAHPLNTPKSPQ